MDEIRFTRLDAAILYSTAQPGLPLDQLIWYYTFVNRDAPPSFEELAGCLSRATRAGVLTVTGDDRFVVTDEWYQRIRQFDDQSPNEIESLIRFEERVLLARDWPATGVEEFRLTLAPYRAA